jgi:EAL domain-containing protein (putative c-di-GMP-specific phosphodiesterase class I)
VPADRAPAPAPCYDSPPHILDIKKVLAGMAPVRMAYQPVVDLGLGAVVGYEALARFGAGHRSPRPYFGAAVAIGRLGDVEALLLQHALDARSTVPDGCFLAVNISPRLLLEGAVWSALTAAGDLSGIVLELTEHERVDNLTPLVRRLDTLRSCGARLALDDVGAGWSGLEQVVELRPDIVKIDRALVQRLHEDPARRAITELLGAFTDKIGGTLLAEGVEVLDELDALLELNVHLAQGFFLGRPQFGWSGVRPEARDALADRVRADRRAGGIAVPAQVVSTAAGVGFLPGGLPRAAIVKSGQRRVTGVWVRNDGGAGPLGWLRDAVTVPASAPVQVALQVAMARPEPFCFDPLVCVDDDGVVVGLLHVAALIQADRISPDRTRRRHDPPREAALGLP